MMVSKIVILFCISAILLSGCSSSGASMFADEENFGQKYCEKQGIDYLEIDVFLYENPDFHVICYDFDKEISIDYYFDDNYKLIEITREPPFGHSDNGDGKDE